MGCSAHEFIAIQMALVRLHNRQFPFAGIEVRTLCLNSSPEGLSKSSNHILFIKIPNCCYSFFDGKPFAVLPGGKVAQGEGILRRMYAGNDHPAQSFFFRKNKLLYRGGWFKEYLAGNARLPELLRQSLV